MQWVGWLGNATDDDTDPPATDGSMHTVPLARDRDRGLLRRLLQLAAVAAVPRPPATARAEPDVVARLPRRQPALRGHRRATAPPGATVWVHDYHLLLVPAMLRARRPDLRIGFVPAHPVPARSCSPRCRGGARSCWACSAPTSSASRRPRTSPTSPTGRARSSQASTRDRSVARPARTVRRRVPDLRRRRRVGSSSATAAARRAGERTARDARAGDGASSASTAWTTPRASPTACRRSANCSTTGALDRRRAVFVQIAVPSRDDVARVPGRARRDRAAGRRGSTARTGAPTAPSRSTTSTTPLDDEELAALVPRGRHAWSSRRSPTA